MDLELKEDLKSINTELRGMNEKMAVHNHILNEHHKRSTLLEERMVPLEDDLKFRGKAWTIFMGSSGLLAVIALGVSIASLLHR
jgi:hypothetical protein